MTRRSLPLARVQDLLPLERGLTTSEAEERGRQYGPNAILESPPRRWRDLARETAKDPMIWFLVGTAALYWIVGQVKEAVILLVAIAPLVAMDLFLHRRTQASTEGLRSRLADRAIVIRDGAEVELPALELVPGDLAIVWPGQPFPADGLVVGGAELQADEATLTGEAYPVAKRPLARTPVGGPEPFVPSEHWGFAGTRLLTGCASLRVVFTGGETLYGEIVRSAVGGAHARTPLQRAIQRLVSVLVAVAAVICLLLAVVRLGQGYGWVDALVSAVTLASAALPEEFPLVFTFFLGLGVYRLAGRQALVRRAVAVENIGRVTCICSDKTGTITEGRLALTHLVAADHLSDPGLLRLAALASRPDSGDPLDAAILREAEAAGALKERGGPLATFPFTEARKRETAIVRDAGGLIVAVTKGAAETVLAMTGLTEADRRAWPARFTALAEEGHKVIACAWRPLDESPPGGDEPMEGYRLAGLLAFEDPVKAGVADAVAMCRGAGIHTIMVTGDHPLTARAVARQIGLGGGEPSVISGDEMQACVAHGEGARLRQVDVVARAAPSQKLTLVRALQDAGEIVAVTGDGVNDVPALQAADVGVAMGERGTRSAREVAAIVLLDDNFRTIVQAIGEGRQLFRNLRASFQYLLMIHIPFVVTAALLPLAGYPLLYLPVHIVWLELVIHPTALLGFQAPTATDRIAPPRARGGRRRFFSGREWAAIVITGGLITAMVVAGYVRSLGEAGEVGHGRAMALAVLTLASAGVTASLSRLRTWSARLVSAGTVALSVACIQTPGLASLLHLQRLHLDDWVTAGAGGLLTGVLAVLPAIVGRDRGGTTPGAHAPGVVQQRFAGAPTRDRSGC
jgi:Ca2+-transporting ATPase